LRGPAETPTRRRRYIDTNRRFPEYDVSHVFQDLSAAIRVGLFPGRCASCGRRLPIPRGPFCTDCQTLVEPVGPRACPRCGREHETELVEEGPCLSCLRASPPFESLHAGFVFRGPVADAVRRFKYRREPGLASSLAGLLPQSPAALHRDRALVVPVPLHSKRLRRRGYNQAALLARHFSRREALEFSVDALERVRPTPPQVEQPSANARRNNVRNAFRHRKNGELGGRDVILIDDVVTSGSTVSDCCRALREAGVRTTFVVTLARG